MTEYRGYSVEYVQKLEVVYDELMLDDYIQSIAKQSLRDALDAVLNHIRITSPKIP